MKTTKETSNALIAKYEELFEANYCEPEEQVIKGSFIGQDKTIELPTPSTSKSKKIKVDLPPQESQPKTTKDIRNFFNSNRRVKSTTTKNASTNVIEIN